MLKSCDVLWISASPALNCFDQPLLQYLAKYIPIAQWEYYQSQDEGSSIYTAVSQLYQFLKSYHRPFHLAGHGMGGAIAFMFARRYPRRVRSLTLLSVASQPANTWHAHYYQQRQLFNLSRKQILINSVHSLFGNQRPYTLEKLVTTLNRDLDESPTLHSLLRLVHLPKGGVFMPMMVCGSKTDVIVSPQELHKWQNCLKPEDTLWECTDGYHFFHYFHPQEVGKQILNFWRSCPQISKFKLQNAKHDLAVESN